MTKHPTLDDVLARPDDLELRMVWADALQQAGDPRGELAALQLAGRPTYEAWAREQALIALHGARWAEPLAEYFDAPYVFEGGVFAGGTPSYQIDPLPDDLERRPGASFAEPAWRAVTTLVGLDLGKRILDDARVPVRHLRRMWESAATTLLAKYREIPLDRIVELGVNAQAQGYADTPLLRTCDALPNLRTLSVIGPRPHLTEMLVEAPVLDRIDRLGIEETDFTEPCLTSLLAAAEASTGALREVVLRFRDRRDLGWRVTLRREVPGPFTSIVAWWHPSEGDRAPKDLAADCVRFLGLVDRNTIRSLAIEVGRPMRFPSNLVRRLAEQMAEMPLEHCMVPWPATAVRRAAAGEQRWQVRLGGCNAIAQIDDAWQAFGPDLGVPWDAMSADGRGTPTLGKQPLETLRKRARKKIELELTLIRTGSTDAIKLARYSEIEGSFTSPRSPHEIAAWFAGAVAKLAPAMLATCALVLPTGEAAGVLDLETYGQARAGWIIALPPSVSRGLAAEHLATLGANVVESPDPSRAVFTIGDDPAAVDDVRMRVFAATLVETLDRLRAADAPVWFAEKARELVAPIAARVGLTQTCETPLRVVWSAGDRSVLVRLHEIAGDWHVRVTVRVVSGELMRLTGPDDLEIAIARMEIYIR